MSIFNYFRRQSTQNTAELAKERLQIIVAHERNKRKQPEFLPQMQKEIIEVIRKYTDVDANQVMVSLEDSDDCSVLELNITLPEQM